MVAVPGPGPQADQAVAVQELVDGAEAVGHPELPGQDLLGLLATQAVDAVGGGGAGLKPGGEAGLGGRGQAGGRAAAGLGGEAGQAVVAVGVDPGLHEVPAAPQGVRDGLGLLPLEGQEHGPAAVAGQGVGGAGAAASQFLKVVGVMGGDVHGWLQG